MKKRLLQATTALVLGLVVSTAAPVQAGSGATIKVILDDTKPSGDAWDAGNPAPDPFIVVDGKSFYSERCQDSYTCKFTIADADPAMSIEVWDADMVDHDFAGSVVCGPGEKCETGKGALVVVF